MLLSAQTLELCGSVATCTDNFSHVSRGGREWKEHASYLKCCVWRARYVIGTSQRACEMAARDVALLEERRRLREAPTSRSTAEQQPASPCGVAKEVSTTCPCSRSLCIRLPTAFSVPT